MTQKERLLEHLKSGKSITCLWAWDGLGISYVGRRIFDLRKDGWDIRDSFMEVENRFKETVRVKRYWLHREEPGTSDIVSH